MTYDLKQAELAFTTALRNGDESAAHSVISEVQAAGVDATAIYLKIFAPSMVTIGELWEQNQLSVAEEHLATEITERLIGQISPSFSPQQAVSEPGRVVMGCVAGERHVLGLRMLADVFRQQGWRVLYLGADVPNQDWLRLVKRFDADLVAISACAERYETQLRTLIGVLRAASPRLEVLIGGGCFDRDQELWRRVGATQHHPDALTAVTMATARYARNMAQRTANEALTRNM